MTDAEGRNAGQILIQHSPAVDTESHINKKRDRPREGRSLLQNMFRRCPALPRGLPRSTIGAEGLNFRVRNGTGCFPLAIAAGNSIEISSW